MNTPIKYEIVKRLFAAKDKPISGQQLADELQISRTAVWKYMKQLEEEGYEFEATRKKGYLLQKSPDTLDPSKIKALLETKRFGREIIYEESLTDRKSVV